MAALTPRSGQRRRRAGPLLQGWLPSPLLLGWRTDAVSAMRHGGSYERRPIWRWGRRLRCRQDGIRVSCHRRAA
eukprot:5874093-Alexandrium_andersonii.AAC.1